ncbi:hypothetical protein DLD82_15620 [Methanospirillum stamsii]|uniref:Uncharacterized protein n=1 Tax=Methanospirillum stamsii TaxID=1277351 RepID=A0A2V2MSW4_9EURY|nr:hypothetical protein DLD82_15620 [Methanospirillum stamsii]
MSDQISDICQVFFIKYKTLSLIFFIILAVFLEFLIHYIFRISTVYIHFIYLLVVLAAIWYQRRAIYLALLFGIIHVAIIVSCNTFYTIEFKYGLW